MLAFLSSLFHPLSLYLSPTLHLTQQTPHTATVGSKQHSENLLEASTALNSDLAASIKVLPSIKSQRHP